MPVFHLYLTRLQICQDEDYLHVFLYHQAQRQVHRLSPYLQFISIFATLSVYYIPCFAERSEFPGEISERYRIPERKIVRDTTIQVNIPTEEAEEESR